MYGGYFDTKEAAEEYKEKHELYVMIPCESEERRYMERLTARAANLKTSAVNQMGHAYIQVDDIDEAMEKLSRYEDTGLEPEEIEDIKVFEGSNTEKYLAEKAKHRWIPVEDQLPPGKEDVLICTLNGWILVAWYGPNGERWHITPTGAGYLPPDIVAWMPLPESYRPEVLREAGADGGAYADAPVMRSAT